MRRKYKSFNPRPRVTGDCRCLTRCQRTRNQHARANLSAKSACGKGRAATGPVSADQRRRNGAANLPDAGRSLQVRAMRFCRSAQNDTAIGRRPCAQADNDVQSCWGGCRSAAARRRCLVPLEGHAGGAEALRGRGLPPRRGKQVKLLDIRPTCTSILARVSCSVPDLRWVSSLHALHCRHHKAYRCTVAVAL